MNNPYLSIVLTGRNDNYGGDFIERLQRCINWNTALLEKHKVTTEFIIVNWNPLSENKPLENLLAFPASRQYVSFKIITVPAEVHQQYIDPSVRKTVPIFEFIAKNAGIRRAKGEYILCINADILIHPQIVEKIGCGKISSHYYYRTNRLDFKEIGDDNSVKELYKNGYVVFLKGFAYYFKTSFNKQIQYQLLRFINPIKIGWELWKYRNHKLCNYLGIPVTYDNAAYYAHCHNSGDFMLMHKAHWFKLKAYPEYTHISTHTDALFTIFAFTELKEYVFSQPVFHQAHERRYSWDAIKQEKTFLDAFYKFEEITKKIFSGSELDNYLNNEAWGLEQFDLAEKEV